MRRYRNVPPLQFLQGFEAAARLGSFSKAAEELGLSQSAVSHEMRLLEERVDQKLFLRIGRAVRLTDAGQVYQRSVRQALDDLDAAHQRLAPFRRESSVVIYAPRDFGRLWLLPRLGNLAAACPGCQPWLDTSGTEVDFSSMEVSIGIIHASEPPAGLISIKIANDIRVPVAAPRILNGLSSDQALMALPLLHHEQLPGWESFFESHALARESMETALDFSDSDAAIAAAEAGLGMALASAALAAGALAERAVERGSLTRLGGRELDTGRGWFAVTNADELANLHSVAVWRWLESQAAPVISDRGGE